MKFEVIFGIDPGRSNGGIAIKKNGTTTLHKMPKDFNDLNAFFGLHKSEFGKDVCFIEFVGQNPADLKNPGKAIAMQKLFLHTQSVKNALKLHQIDFIEVHPRSWQKELNLIYKGIEKNERKKKYQQYAVNILKRKVPLYAADAVCLLVFGMKKINFDQMYLMKNLPPETTLF